MTRVCENCRRPLSVGSIIGAIGNRMPGDDDKKLDVIRCPCGAWYRLKWPWLSAAVACALSLGAFILVLAAPWTGWVMSRSPAHPYAQAAVVVFELAAAVLAILYALALCWPLRRGTPKS